MKMNGWTERDNNELKKQTRRCTFLSVSEMKIWLGGFVILFVFMILLLKFKLLEGPLVQSYFGTHEDQLALNYVTNTSHSALHIDAEESMPTATPKSNIEQVVDPPFIASALSQVRSSAAESSILAVWNQLKPVFTRSECFPEAKQGLKEAEISWGELMHDLKLESSHKGNSSVTKSAEIQCPYSSSSITNTGTDGTLEIPCGLIVDSSITIVAMPWGAEGNFAVELVGPNIPGELDPPIVLHFNVRLQGDKITESAVIVQNTWNRDDDWGDEERCPSPPQKTKKVDGLDTCSDQIGKVTATRSFEVKNSKTNAKSTADDDKRPSFPFLNGLPFAATLWVGWEGFHMTVNGKHVTSFEYRQNWKPSLVGSVRLKGAVKSISIMATGLPASEDVTQVDLKFLKAPPLAPKQKSELFVGVFSTGNNFDRRMAVRRSWMQYEDVRSGRVTVRFFVGQHSNKQVNRELWKEALTYGDIQLMPFVDYYNLITLKTIAICIFGTEIMRANYVMKTDDDTFVRIDEVLSVLNRTRERKGLLCGFIEYDSQPHRDPTDKWYIKTEEWSSPDYPPWAHGPGYVISKDIAKFVVQSHYNSTLKLFKLEDVSMGIWVDEFKRHGHTVHYDSNDRFNHLGCSENYVIAHYQNPKHMMCLWEKLKEGSGPTCCE